MRKRKLAISTDAKWSSCEAMHMEILVTDSSLQSLFPSRKPRGTPEREEEKAPHRLAVASAPAAERIVPRWRWSPTSAARRPGGHVITSAPLSRPDTCAVYAPPPAAWALGRRIMPSVGVTGVDTPIAVHECRRFCIISGNSKWKKIEGKGNFDRIWTS